MMLISTHVRTTTSKGEKVTIPRYIVTVQVNIPTDHVHLSIQHSCAEWMWPTNYRGGGEGVYVLGSVWHKDLFVLLDITW